MIKVGDDVTIKAKDNFFAFVNGWRGFVSGFNNGLAVVECPRDDGPKTFYVPTDQLKVNT